MQKDIRRGLIRVAVLLATTSMAVLGFADTLVLKNGEQISGYYEGGTARMIRFRTESGLGEYDLLTVEEIRFGGDVVSSSPSVVEPIESPPGQPRLTRTNPAEIPDRESATAATPATDVPPVRLQTREEVGRRAEATNAANTAWTIPTGSTLMVRMIDGIDSEENRAGQTFTATLAETLRVEGIEVAPRGADIRGRIALAEDAGRVRGSAELRLELSQIVVNGVPYALNTSEYSEVAEGRGEETARRVGTGAGIGAIIGAIVGGGQGAAIGAGVGAGAAGTVQVLTRGERIYIPAETLLGFTLREPLIIAAR
jgi:hypothetical protein